MPANPYKLRLLNANCTCSDCEHFLCESNPDEGFCHEAAEALALEGWPRVTVFIEPHMSAESCPMFADNRPQPEREYDKYEHESRMESEVRAIRGFSR